VAATLPTVAELRRVAVAAFPERRLRRFHLVRGGWANLVLEADGELIFRFPRRIEVARALGFEVRLLDYLARRLSTPLPTPLRIGTLNHPEGWPFMVYQKLPGVPLLDYRPLRGPERARLQSFVARFLHELSELSSAPIRRLGCNPGDPLAWRRLYLGLRERYERVGVERVPTRLDRQIRAEFDGFLPTLGNSHYRAVVTHRDLGPYNILWDPAMGRPSGVIDWEDARLGDPAFDLVGLVPFGPSFLRPLRKLRKRPDDSEFDRRLRFYRRIRYLPEMLHGIETRQPRLFRQKVRELQADLERGL
jgi:aminoglycoside 2''-phosphotransferase